jgi:hypothetical protein
VEPDVELVMVKLEAAKAELPAISTMARNEVKSLRIMFLIPPFSG